MSGVSFPPILQILPKKVGSSSGLEYHLDMDPRQRFKGRQVVAFRRILGEYLRSEYTATVSVSGSRLIVQSTPADTMDEVEFHVLNTLRALLKPQVPHSAVGVQLSGPGQLKWFVAGVQVVGFYDMAQIRELQEVLKSLTGVRTSRLAKGDNRAIELTFDGDWRKQVPYLVEEAASKGIGIFFHQIR